MRNEIKNKCAEHAVKSTCVRLSLMRATRNKSGDAVAACQMLTPGRDARPRPRPYVNPDSAPASPVPILQRTKWCNRGTNVNVRSDALQIWLVSHLSACLSAMSIILTRQWHPLRRHQPAVAVRRYVCTSRKRHSLWTSVERHCQPHENIQQREREREKERRRRRP